MDIDKGTRPRRKLRRKGTSNQRHEIWFEIFTRLSFKSLLTCRAVCKSWKNKILRLQDDSELLPLCGLILKSSFGVSNINNVDMNYINLTTKEVTNLRPNDPKSLIVNVASNGNDEYRLMSDLSFDFGGLYGRNPSQVPLSWPKCYGKELTFDFDKLWIDKRPESPSCFFAIHQGLVLVVHEDGNYVVHNPLTRKVTRLPKPPSFKQYDSKDLPLEKVGLIIKASICCLSNRCRYLVVRVCRISRVIEVYMSYREPLRWRVYKLKLDEELIQACWYWENTVVSCRTKTLFFLTNKDRGVAIRFWERYPPAAYGFGLPRLVQEGFENARLGVFQDSLHLSYYNSNGVWIWKHVIDGTKVTSDTWIPILEVSRDRQLCKPLAMRCLCNVLNAGSLVVPLAFHPFAAVVFFCIQSCIFAYDLDLDTFDKIAEIPEIVHQGSSPAVLPYAPCLASVVAKRFRPLNKAPPMQDNVMC
ncbi:hypothetical protein RND81_05G190600 [Saponaria officinalis]|uniref:F-box domain-containing protein n=1 Tax=Saponaria officinalis TaxID=3572 RepID=A0AAW1KU53_SAPOF